MKLKGIVCHFLNGYFQFKLYHMIKFGVCHTLTQSPSVTNALHTHLIFITCFRCIYTNIAWNRSVSVDTCQNKVNDPEKMSNCSCTWINCWVRVILAIWLHAALQTHLLTLQVVSRSALCNKNSMLCLWLACFPPPDEVGYQHGCLFVADHHSFFQSLPHMGIKSWFHEWRAWNWRTRACTKVCDCFNSLAEFIVALTHALLRLPISGGEHESCTTEIRIQSGCFGKGSSGCPMCQGRWLRTWTC